MATPPKRSVQFRIRNVGVARGRVPPPTITKPIPETDRYVKRTLFWAFKGLSDTKQHEALEWPVNSPDLNPIENLWTQSFREEASKWTSISKGQKPASGQVLVKAIKDVWIRPNLLSSTSCQYVTSSSGYDKYSKGGHTKY